jgi:hypothetical protein
VNGSIVPGIAGERDVTRPRWLLVLEDDEERTAAFRQAAARIRPAVEPRFWRSAHRFVAEAGEFLPDSVLISLDHDLNLQPGDAGDPDDGLQVAIWLAGRVPTGPVIVHSSNHLRVESQRVVNVVNVLARAELQSLRLREAIRASESIVRKVRGALAESAEISQLGLEVLGLSILAIKPSPETARALEAETREQLLKEADEAIYSRRNSAVEQERAIKENELNTEVAVENKRRQIREAQMDAERAVQEKRAQLQQSEMFASIELEERRKSLVALAAGNARTEADARAYGISAAMQAIGTVNPATLQALASVGMKPDQLIAVAFQELAGRADRIGQLNISPDLLRELMSGKTGK